MPISTQYAIQLKKLNFHGFKVMARIRCIILNGNDNNFDY